MNAVDTNILLSSAHRSPRATHFLLRPRRMLLKLPAAPRLSEGRRAFPGIGHAEEVTVGIVSELGEAVQGIDGQANKSTLKPDPKFHRTDPKFHRTDPKFHRTDPKFHRISDPQPDRQSRCAGLTPELPQSYPILNVRRCTPPVGSSLGPWAARFSPRRVEPSGGAASAASSPAAGRLVSNCRTLGMTGALSLSG